MSKVRSKHESRSSALETGDNLVPEVSFLPLLGHVGQMVRDKLAEKVGPNYSLSPLAWKIDSDHEDDRMTASKGLAAIMAGITDSDNRYEDFGTILVEVPGADNPLVEDLMLIACLGVYIDQAAVEDLQLKLAEDVNRTLKLLGSPIHL